MRTLPELTDAEIKEIKLCPNGKPHRWVYQGKHSGKYSCSECGFETSKGDLKDATD